MASFDIIEAAGYGYREAWRHRRYLARLAAVPLLLDIACGGAVAALGWNTQYLRQGLAMLPAVFAQGWMLSHYVRLLVLEQSWPFRPSGNAVADRAALDARMRGIVGGTVLFALSRFLLFGVTEIAYRLNQQEGTLAGDPLSPHHLNAPAATPAAALLALFVVVGAFWGIRLLWLFVPGAVDQPLRPVLQRLRGFGTSFFLAGTGLVCFMPLMTLCLMVTLPGTAGPAGPLLAAGRVIVQASADMAIAFILTGGIVQGFRVMLGAAPTPKTRR